MRAIWLGLEETVIGLSQLGPQNLIQALSLPPPSYGLGRINILRGAPTSRQGGGSITQFHQGQRVREGLHSADKGPDSMAGL